ncbi:hypothetical protein [Nocardia sp. NPDC057668]|uniref:hypothetical protein n=1 Tax=Nocardia sp. NPDC057668 TaxID=3346202 RepID=UPI00366B0A90
MPGERPTPGEQPMPGGRAASAWTARARVNGSPGGRASSGEQGEKARAELDHLRP